MQQMVKSQTKGKAKGHSKTNNQGRGNGLRKRKGKNMGKEGGTNLNATLFVPCKGRNLHVTFAIYLLLGASVR